MHPISSALLYGILDTGYCPPDAMPAMLRAMLAGGIRIVQLRAKDQPAHRVLALARALHPISRAAGVPFIINDHPQLVPEAGVEGAHVGQDDMSVAAARALAGPGKIIGLSTHTVAQAIDAAAQQPDYIGFGPLFATQTKPDYPPIGTADIREIHTRLTLPIFCIGGIKKENLPAVLAAGARRAVIVSGILTAPHPRAYTAECITLLHAGQIPL